MSRLSINVLNCQSVNTKLTLSSPDQRQSPFLKRGSGESSHPGSPPTLEKGLSEDSGCPGRPCSRRSGLSVRKRSAFALGCSANAVSTGRLRGGWSKTFRMSASRLPAVRLIKGWPGSKIPGCLELLVVMPRASPISRGICPRSDREAKRGRRASLAPRFDGRILPFRKPTPHGSEDRACLFRGRLVRKGPPSSR